MKKIGIIFAMVEELEAFKKYAIINSEHKIYNLTFLESSINNIDLILVQSGIGKVNAARTTQILIDNFKVDFVFNVGVAGGISSDLKIGDIVFGEKMVQHDFDITAFNHKKGYIPDIGEFIDASSLGLKMAKEVVENTNINARFGVIASGDIFITDTKMTDKIHKKFNALCVEMEGASIAQVCYLCSVPFLIIRSISDVPNNDNKVTYETFLKSSSEKVSLLMLKIINNIKK